MTIPYTDSDRFGQSYPPSLWTPPAPSGPPAIAVPIPGTPGHYDDQYGDEWTGALPPNLAALEVMFDATYQSPAWDAGDSVPLGDGSEAYWDGSEFVDADATLADLITGADLEADK